MLNLNPELSRFNVKVRVARLAWTFLLDPSY